jgi:hypothetical protein
LQLLLVALAELSSTLQVLRSLGVVMQRSIRLAPPVQSFQAAGVICSSSSSSGGGSSKQVAFQTGPRFFLLLYFFITTCTNAKIKADKTSQAATAAGCHHGAQSTQRPGCFKQYTVKSNCAGSPASTSWQHCMQASYLLLLR